MSEMGENVYNAMLSPDFYEMARLAESKMEARLDLFMPVGYVDKWWLSEIDHPMRGDAAYEAYSRLSPEKHEQVKQMALKMVGIFKAKEPPYTTFCMEDALIILAHFGWCWPEFGNSDLP